MKINIFYDKINYRLRETGEVKKLIVKVIRDENRIPGDLNFILTSDEKIREINNEFLKRDNFTDVIAFDYSENDYVNGEIYISIETVRCNAVNYKVSLKSEMIRVMIHGTLHLCGYNDKTKNERVKMKKQEDKWIKEYKKRK